MGSFIAPKQYVQEWMTTCEVKYCLKYARRDVEIFFSHLDSEYRLNYKFKDVYGDMIVERQDNKTILTIPLRFPAMFWKRNPQSVKETPTSIHIGPRWERVTLIPLTKDVDLSKKPKPKPLTLNSRDDVLDIGNWVVLRLTFAPAPRHVAEFENKLKEAADFDLVPRDLSSLPPVIQVIHAKDLPTPSTHVDRTAMNLPFDVLYLLESVISYRYCNPYNLTPEFLDLLKRLNENVSRGCFELISLMKKRIYNPYNYFQRAWDTFGIRLTVQKNIPSHCAMLRKVIVTPSHLYIQPPSLETTNRVVRHYKNHTDRFIRVQFMDENLSRVGAAQNELMKEVIYDRIFGVLKKGIMIGDTRYEFLAFSSSQLREQGCWFFAPTDDLTPDMIRAWMGVFSHEKVVAKHAVRMGQCFSSTRPVRILQENEVAYIKDVVHNGFTFSDGVGKISPALAEEVAMQMELKSIPSAFQFRLGGAKGVLTVDKNLNEGPVKVQLRPSQIKFQSKHLTLEVIRTSTYIHGYLNRQIITLLSALGVKDQVFMDFMDDMLLDIDRIFQRPEEAVRVLLSNVDNAGTVHSMVPIIQAGFMERKDPYITNLLNLFRISILKDLKKKAKIIVPKGAYLLGVMDETDTLEEGEVFIQIYDNNGTNIHKEVITGEIVVFRNPCFHPGDVRVVKAVDRPNLHHLLDVVVFSAKGFRDIPSMCSGGDLDGDDYTVYWDPRLLPAIKNFTPMDYTAPPSNIVEDVKNLDIIKFFVNYITYDNLGQIANAHLATADLSANGARDGKCILLAQLHSEAVDFPKSGKPAKLTEDLIVKTFPDFMQKKDKESYQSKKVLGRIFRAIDKSNYKDFQDHLTQEAMYDTRLHVPGMEMYIGEARRLRYLYNRDLNSIMNKNGVGTEAEICSGYIIKWIKKGKSKTDFEQHESTLDAVKTFKSVWKKKFEKEFYDEKKTVDMAKRHKMDAKAAAWYYVTYHPDERRRDMSVEGGFLSFPWCIYEYICAIAKRNTHKMLDPSLYEPFEEEVIQAGEEKLKIDRGEVCIIDESDEEEDDKIEYETDDSSDEEIMVYPSTHGYGRTASSVTATEAAAAATAKKDNSILVDTGFVMNHRPLEAHQSVIGADASPDELAKALLGADF